MERGLQRASITCLILILHRKSLLTPIVDEKKLFCREAEVVPNNELARFSKLTVYRKDKGKRSESREAKYGAQYGAQGRRSRSQQCNVL